MSYRRADEMAGCGGSLLWLVVAPVAGCWWWVAGLPVAGEPRAGGRRVTLCVVRALVLAFGVRLMWGEVGDPGWGTGVVLGCAAAGLVAKSRRHRHV